MKHRTAYFDFLRGIAILMVVAIHTFPGGGFETITDTILLFIRQIVGCPVPIFLAISGFFLGNKCLYNKQNKSDFWKKQIPKVYIPALIWSFLYFLLTIRGGDNPLYATVMLVCMGFSIYYFIALIIQCYLLLPLLQKADSHRFLGGIILTVSIISGILIAWYGANRLPLIVYAGPFTTWIVFFYLGITLSRADRNYSIKPYTYLLVLSLVAMMIEAYFLYKNGLGGAGLKPTVYIYSLLMVIILFSKQVQNSYNDKKLLNRMICYIGNISFGIYLIHCIVLMALGRILIVDNWLVNWLLTVTVSILIITTCRRLMPERIIKIIGFK